MKQVQDGDVVRFIHAGHVISEAHRHARATDSVFDVMAASIDALSPGPKVAVLGFAAGGVLSPLRALGGNHRVDGVDMDARGHALFVRQSSAWAGDVTFHLGDAATFLERGRQFDCVLEDLSLQVEGDAIKPEVCFVALPPLVRRALRPGGVAIYNLVRTPKRPFPQMMNLLCQGYRECRQVLLTDWENRLLLCGDTLPPPRKLGLLLRERLEAIGSNLAGGMSVRAV